VLLPVVVVENHTIKPMNEKQYPRQWLGYLAHSQMAQMIFPGRK
jgi:hypothetical protein